MRYIKYNKYANLYPMLFSFSWQIYVFRGMIVNISCPVFCNLEGLL